MTTYHQCSISSELVAYLIGEASEEEINAIDMHLLNCPSCCKELQEMQEAWNLIPYKLEDVEVPSDLKEEVMNAIFQSADPTPEQKNIVTKHFSPLSRSIYGIVAAVFLFSFAGLIWNNFILREQLTELKDRTPLQSNVIRVFTLKSANPSTNSAQGSAWLYNQGNSKKLVFQIQGLAETKGTEAYQVWLIHEGNRKSAGTFHVDKEGNGYLTYQFNEKEVPFEAIGVSLEPDENGTQPRGKKVLGT